jgi:hypothetical protein
VTADAQFDGVFVLRTNMKLSALAVVLRYRNLLAVEQSFFGSKDSARHATSVPPHRCPVVAQGVARLPSAPLCIDTEIAAHHRRSARSQCR